MTTRWNAVTALFVPMLLLSPPSVPAQVGEPLPESGDETAPQAPESAAEPAERPQAPDDQAVPLERAPGAGSGSAAASASGIAHTSGGVGVEERERLEAESRNYNLKLIFAASANAPYLSDVGVTIIGPRGDEVLKATSDGPWFYAKLPPGSYTVVANAGGKTLRQTAQVPPSGQARLAFYWRDPKEPVSTR
ncbi:MAG: hypothetical protein QOD06_1191 [Candidatus Binatota bacterium]|nr:hypothetical protein [Candidatus Binatota bacterium]